MTVLVTGASGMIGSQVVTSIIQAGCAVVGLDLGPAKTEHALYTHIRIDLGDRAALESVFEEYVIDRVIHLAALAHDDGSRKLTRELYQHVNVACAEHVFEAAASRRIPILFSSTVDVYGFAGGEITPKTRPRPVSEYGKSKYDAERSLVKICRKYNSIATIFRFAPVYTAEQKRDIQKRYYLKAPKLAYRIGRGSCYEVLRIDHLLDAVTKWVQDVPCREIRLIKDEMLLDTAACIREEKEAGRAAHVLTLPRWMVTAAYTVLRNLFGENPKLYLLHKAVRPYRSEEWQSKNKNEKAEGLQSRTKERGAERPRVLFISSSGGHYEQLKMLKPVMDQYDSKVVTEKVLSAGKADYYMVQISHTDKGILFKFAWDLVKAARIWVKEKPDYIVSTGSMIVIPFAILAKLTHRKIIFIETFAVREKPTLTGKLMYKWADLFIVQWESLLKVFPNAVYGGSIY